MTASCFLSLEEHGEGGLKELKISDTEKLRKGFAKGIELELNLVKEYSSVEERERGFCREHGERRGRGSERMLGE